ncbi:MAG TPA: DUF1269 domain-containing protein [Acidimicrobiales bacterium]
MAKSSDPVFVFVGTYDDEGTARSDYDVVKDLHALGAVGNYDAAVITKDDGGQVHVNKDETVTRKLGWGGAGVGALVGILFPPAIVGSALVGAAVGGVGGHLWKGMSRSDMKDLGQVLDEGEAALVVVGESKVEEAVENAVKRAEKRVAKELDLSTEEVDEEFRAIARQLASS